MNGRVAIIHDHLTQAGGAERVLEVLHSMYPTAPIYSLVYDESRVSELNIGDDIRTSFLQRIPGGVWRYQWLLPLMPWATERYNLSEYDVVISSASSFAKGVLTNEKALHLCYCHTPTRYLWSDAHTYVDELPYPAPLRALIFRLLVRLRSWDYIAAQRPDILLANSETVRRRIKKFYRRESEVLHPPVDINAFAPTSARGHYYLTGGRLVTYKRFDIVIEAFNRLRMPLKVFGDGPARAKLERSAKSNIEFMGFCAPEILAKAYAECRAFIQPQEEDFGITAVEAMASGRPVIAYGAGGALETVVDGRTGVFFDEQSWEAIAEAVVRFRVDDVSGEEIRNRAESFSVTRFKERLSAIVGRAYGATGAIGYARRR